ncbi:hypothetical protein EV284_0400 [Streptomyces sp. BK022]|nr:hypothetical protein EV284_0400 [Streptomyces sp. BK022]
MRRRRRAIAVDGKCLAAGPPSDASVDHFKSLPGELVTVSKNINNPVGMGGGQREKLSRAERQNARRRGRLSADPGEG